MTCYYYDISSQIFFVRFFGESRKSTDLQPIPLKCKKKKIKNYLPTKLSMCSSSPSASPLSRSSATIMKSLSGNSNCSLFCMWAKCWFRVCSTRLTHRLKTGSQYGRKPSCSAVATEERHSNKGNRSLSSSLSAFHFCNKIK